MNPTIKGAVIGAGAVLALGAAGLVGHLLTRTTPNSVALHQSVTVHHVATPSPSPSATSDQQTQPKPEPTQAPAALPPLLVIGSYSGMRPTTLYVGADNEIIAINWQSWGPAEAVGNGSQMVNSCQPDCASGKVTYESVRIILAAVQGATPTNGGEYTQITETDASTGQTVNGAYGTAVSSFLIGAAGGQQGNY